MQTPGPGRPAQSLSAVHGLQVPDCVSQVGFAALAQSALDAHSTHVPLGPHTGADGWRVAHTVEPVEQGPQVPVAPQTGRSAEH